VKKSVHKTQQAFSPQELATILGIAPDTIRDRIRDKSIPARRVGHLWRIPRWVVNDILLTQDNPVGADELVQALDLSK
jgi:excisionase family DNA binding protein